MKIFFTILNLIFFVLITNVEAGIISDTKLNKGNFYQEKIIWRSIELNLPEGKWEYMDNDDWWYGGFGYSCKSFATTENNIFKSLIEICEVSTGGKYLWALGPLLYKHYTKGKYDSCILRPEYYYAKLFIKGNSSNCLKVRHIDIDKELNYPDDPDSLGRFRILKKWIKDNNIIFPKILLYAQHEYFAPSVGDRGPSIYYLINPELYGGPKEQFFTEETSEYHRNNIKKYPKFKKFMNEWRSLSAKRHKEFEIMVKAKQSHKLDLNEVIIPENKTSIINDDNDIVKKIKELKKLYEEGALTKEEFEKAKKKILN